MKRSNLLSLAVAAVVAAGLGSWTALHRSSQPPALEGGILLPQPRPIADFSLTDQDGKAFNRARLSGHWTLVFVGYTRCPDVCPNTLAVMKALEGRLAAAPQMVFISVDPQRDAPDKLRQYVRYFSPTMVGATGPATELDKLCANLGVAYMRVGTGADYAIDHSAVLVLVNPRAEVAGYFQPPHKVDVLAADLSRVAGWRS